MITNHLQEELQTPNFDIREFLLKHFLSPDFRINYSKIALTMPQILAIQLQTCEDIAASVDNNLEDYVQISSQLTALQQQLDTLTRQFQAMETAISMTKDELEQTIYQINVIVENLKLIHNLESQMQKLRKLTKNLKQCSNPLLNDDYHLIQNAEIIMKIRRIFQEIDKSPHCRSICTKYEIVSEINHQYNSMSNVIEKEFVICIQEETINIQRLRALLKCFGIFQLTKTPEKLIVQFILKPKIDTIYHQLIQNKHLLNKDSTNLEQFLQSIIEIYSEYKVVDEYKIDGFSFKQILVELVYIYLSQKDCVNVYSLGVLDLFQDNFQKIQSMKQCLEFKFTKGSEIERKFLEKWNLQTYFQMRQSEIIRSFEQQMQISVESQELKVTAVLEEHIQRCFSGKVFIVQLQGRFIAFTIQLLNRFIGIIQSHQFKDSEYCLIINQLTQIQKIDQLPEQLNQLQIGKLKQLIDLIIEKASQSVIIECCANLEPFSGIPAKFRMTNREMPSQSSNFCSNIFRALSQFLQKIEADWAKVEISRQVCGKTLERFNQIKKSALETCDKNDELMQKMGVKKSDSQDNQKIRLQFQIDSDEIENIIKSKFIQ